MKDDFNPFEDLGLTEHIKMCYGLVFPINKTTVIIIRRPTLNDGNFGSEEPEATEIRYEVQLNVNPVRAKPFITSKEGIVKQYSHEVFSNPTIYPQFGTDKNGKKIDVVLKQILSTDLIIFNNATYSLSESFEDVSLNDQDMLWQHFFMKILA